MSGTGDVQMYGKESPLMRQPEAGTEGEYPIHSREGTMSDEADRKAAEEVWRRLLDISTWSTKTGAVEIIEPALAQARREGRREGIEKMRNAAIEDYDNAHFEYINEQDWFNTLASRLLEAEK